MLTFGMTLTMKNDYKIIDFVSSGTYGIK